LSLFAAPDPVLAEKVSGVDVNRLTPLEALLLVSELKKIVEGGS
jgi:hypothetical protein